MLLLSVETWTWNNGTSGLERGLTYGSEFYDSRKSIGHYKEQWQPILYVVQLVLIHTNGWLAFFLVFQFICNSKEYWQLKQDWFQLCMVFSSNLPEVLKILLHSLELLCSNHGETDSLCGMFNTTAIQFPTCVVILQQKKIFNFVSPFSHIPVCHRHHPAQICALQLFMLARAGQHEINFSWAWNQFISLNTQRRYISGHPKSYHWNVISSAYSCVPNPVQYAYIPSILNLKWSVQSWVVAVICHICWYELKYLWGFAKFFGAELQSF